MADTQRPDITVVIPCFNAEAWVARAIDSVLAQEGVRAEVIVIDDGSTDGSVEVLKRYGDRIRWETGPNRGACTARNRGLTLASADYVMFLDADDWIEGDFLASALKSMVAAKADLAFGRYIALGDALHVDHEPPPALPAKAMMHRFLQQAFVPPCATVWRASFLQDIGGWKEGLRRAQDLEIVFRGLAHDPVVGSIRGGNGIYYQHDSGVRISSRMDVETLRHRIEVLESMGQNLRDIGYTEEEANVLRHKKAYDVWRQTARSGSIEAERIAHDYYSQIGGRGHQGSKLHLWLAGLIGLRRKERFSVRLARVRSGLGVHRQSHARR